MTGPRDYGREYTRLLPGPLRLRLGYTTDRGEVRRFLVQLEYAVGGEWLEVVRYDYDPGAAEEMAHDVREEGLHIDMYRDGEKVDTRQVSGPIEPDEAFDRAEEHLETHLQTIVERFERWHGIRSP